MKRFSLIEGILVSVILCILGALAIYLVTDDWELAHIGSVDRVEYLPGGFATNEKTIIRFKDGRIVILFGHHGVPRGDIKVFKCRRRFKIKAITTPQRGDEG